MLGRTIQNQEKLTEDSRSLLDVVVDYTYALDTLDRYDYQELKIEGPTGKAFFHVTYENAMEVIRELHEKFGGSTLFGKEKDDSFKSSIGQIYQTFGGIDLYPSVEEKAAMLLYLVTKNHSFSDGNKRIAATLFLWFLNGNGILYNEDVTKRIADNTLVALTLLIAESRKRGSGVLSPLRSESGKTMTVLSAGCRRKVTVDVPLTLYDRIAPMDIGGNKIRG